MGVFDMTQYNAIQHAGLIFQEHLDQIHVVAHSLIWKLPCSLICNC